MINPVKHTEPQPLPTTPEKSRFTDQVQALPFGRWYALNDGSLRAGVALNRAALALNEALLPSQMQKLIARIAELEPTLTQTWKGSSAPKLPDVWKNPITGLALPNPWADPIDRNGQNVLLQNDPLLAAMLEKLADNPYQLLVDMRAAEQRRKALAAISYTDADHASNPYRDNTVRSNHAQMLFRASQGDLVADVWTWEGLNPVRLPWATSVIHRSECGRIIQSLDESPIAGIGGGDVITLAMKFDVLIIKAERQAAEDAAEAANKRAQAFRGVAA